MPHTAARCKAPRCVRCSGTAQQFLTPLLANRDRSAFKNFEATDFGVCLLFTTAAFIARIAACVSFALTAFIVLLKSAAFEPSAVRSLLDASGATFWTPKMSFGSLRTTYFPLASCGRREDVDAGDLLLIERLVRQALVEGHVFHLRQAVTFFMPRKPSSRSLNSGLAPTEASAPSSGPRPSSGRTSRHRPSARRSRRRRRTASRSAP